jgi:hypothetical protein
VDLTDTPDTAEVSTVMYEAMKWSQKPRKLRLGLKLPFEQWKRLVSILGGEAASLQIAVPRNSAEGDKTHSFLCPTDQLGKNQRANFLPRAEEISCLITGPDAYTQFVIQSREETLGVM